ncbi:hypothetical protein AGMMS49957_11210 [Synergistales bacterium]|nr:hypothetical protein AGMMS49957_11180 [Synergistales bacterium]GHS88910.1 hypothetical protein AGMMS49957_11210 [Synergistales bacterium]
MTLARVFPRKTNATPEDEYAFVGLPPAILPEDITEIHISTAFTYDIEEAERLYGAWSKIAPCSIGGPATGQRGEDFVPGKYLKQGYVITSRGCDGSCWFCVIPKREGSVRELPVREGRNVLDDNLLACSESHIRAVFKMLERQKKQKHRTFFTGGLEAARIQEWHIELLKKLRPKEIFFGCDTEEKFHHLREALKLFKEAEYTSRNTLHAYVLIGYPKDTLQDAEKRLERVKALEVCPMAMLYRDVSGFVKEPIADWKRLQRLWARPALIYRKL